MLDGRSLESDAHAIGFLGDAIVRLHEGAPAPVAEIVVLRSPDDAYRSAAVVERLRQPLLVARRRLLAGERQHVAGRELAAFEAADAGARIGRQAAHERGQ